MPESLLGIHDTLLDKATVLGAKVAQMSFAVPSGLAWPIPGQPEVWQRAAIKGREYDLHSGIGGIAVFLAALARVTNASRYRSLARAALLPLCGLTSAEIDAWLVRSSMAAGTGALSVIYSLLKAAEFLDQELLAASFRIARHVPEERLTCGKMADLMGGTAGYALVWTALYRVAPEPWILERAALCGEHLLGLRTVTAAGFRAWETSPGIHAAGYAHGTAGIVSALCKVFEITGDRRFHAAADEGRIYEDTLYNQAEENWPHLLMPDGQGSFEYWNSWCSGAPGIGIGRLHSTACIGQSQLKEDIERILRTATKSGRFGHLDFPCCGTLGRVELFLQAAQHPGMEHYQVHALQLADAVVRRAVRKGTYGYGRESANPPLTFHKGLTGIGYQLLRTACPELLPSILSWE